VIAYVDTSVLLRILLDQRDRLSEWNELESAVTSALTEVECFRTLDRYRLREAASDQELAALREQVFRLLEVLRVVDLDRAVLARAAQSTPTALGTLDALHLATALLWRERMGGELVMATHDAELGMAARASGLRVIGVPATA